MTRKVFFSFHYDDDHWRASQVRKIGALEGNQAVSDNDWEEVTDGGDAAIEKWINAQLQGKSCAVVLIGSNTAGRKWIKYEIRQAWSAGKGLLGIHIHNLKNSDEEQSKKGGNPFDVFTVGNDAKKRKLSDIVPTHDPPFSASKDVYDYIKTNIEEWVEAAIKIRDDA